VAVEHGVGEIARRQTIAGTEDATEPVIRPLILTGFEAAVELGIRQARGAEDDAVADKFFHSGAGAARQTAGDRLLGSVGAVAIEIEERTRSALPISTRSTHWQRRSRSLLAHHAPEMGPRVHGVGGGAGEGSPASPLPLLASNSARLTPMK
jgi:hypothetical protein